MARSRFIYDRLEWIGQGSFSRVQHGVRREDGLDVALKYVEGSTYIREQELDILDRLWHRNITNLLDILLEDSQLESKNKEEVEPVMVLEYAPISIEYLLDEYKVPFPEAGQLECFINQVAQGLAYLHDNSIVHRDISPGNILVTRGGIVKISDFGMARYLKAENDDGQLTPDVCTLWYRAPEILSGSTDYSFPVDMWAFGCVICEVIQGIPVFGGDNEDEELKLIQTVTFPVNKVATKLPADTDLNLLDLLKRLLEYDAGSRIPAGDVLKHAFLATSEPDLDALDMSMVKKNETRIIN